MTKRREKPRQELTAAPLELDGIKRRWQPFLERLPEYRMIYEEILFGKK
ncbi:MAG TPA: hypothetical protein IAB00_05840 [Candidatus Avidehalobacter gallistercoris]|uniref:Uncharacterized protein n=1 Tax=Candidatus Avidehalobacter gallistercoris TaxID=2840694 RepID=A0A9D1KY48_9FIRM|nr:hypothetical protein [Candidatus Avidehalobacter gallistercoris]